ncbi:MAG: hypothetical protein RLO81_05610 [Fulvivirga sp.]|uniref:hypothetical protein n=1 Tax=Fulvivirga sp. TaxID=1931237 RepID=UPI0032EE163C
MIRKLFTLYYALFFGDISGLWGKNVAEYLLGSRIVKKGDSVISFFTPRGPIFAGYLIKNKIKCDWIVDFQDNHDIGQKYKFLSRYWMKRVLKNADKCVHVSPEWAEKDGEKLGKSFMVIRHALPKKEHIVSLFGEEEFTFFYYGGFNVDYQYHEFFFKYLNDNPETKFAYAGFEQVDQIFSSKLNSDQYIYLGWLSSYELFDQLSRAKFVVVFGFTLASRSVVPSKLYELIALKIPIIIIGNDSGGIKDLENETSFMFSWAKNEKQLQAIVDSPQMINQDYSAFDIYNQDSFINNYLNILEPNDN